MRSALRQRRDEEQRATFLELFFDLVFVLAVTQLSHVLLADTSWAGAAKMGFLLLVVWWAWIYTTWMTNWFDPELVSVRLVLLFGMTASAAMAIAIPEAFNDRALLFASGYVALQTVRNVFIVVATDRSEPLHEAFVRICAWNAWVGMLWILGGMVTGDARVGVWGLALVCDYAGPLLRYWTPGLGASVTTDWEVEHAHFAERFQLFVIIVLGESIVLIGSTASGLEFTDDRLLAILVSLLITAALWWLYFDEVAKRSQQDLATAASEDKRERLARDAFTYLHLPIVAGVIVTAVAAELVIAHPSQELAASELVAVTGGPILYLLGHIGFRLRMIGTFATQRFVAVLALLGVAGVGRELNASFIWLLILGVLVVLTATETVKRLRTSDPETS